MPTYDYECDACGHRYELFQSIKAAPIRKCPACKKLKARRLIGIGAGVIFKGSGFYCTDYRDKAYATSAKNDKPPAAAGDNGKTPTADKPAATSEKSASDKPASDKPSSSDSSAAKTPKTTAVARK
jgi:putative FmdB family regulatory protein